MELSIKSANELESRMEAVEGKLDSAIKVLEKIDRGLNGDPDNEVPGLRERVSTLQKQVETLQSEVAGIHKKNEAQDLAISTKINTKKGIWNTIKIIGEICMAIVTVYFVVKGVFGFDALKGIIH